MILTTLPILLLPFLAGLPDDEVHPAAPSVLRTYDLSAVTPRVEEGEQAMPLMPLSELLDLGYIGEGEGGSWQEFDTIFELVFEVFAEEFEYEDRSIHIDGDRGRLVVVAPEALQSRIARLLTDLERNMSAGRIELTVDTVLLGPEDELPPGGAVLNAREAQAWLDGLGEVAERQSFGLRLDPGLPSALDMTRQVPVLIDYDVEIAQGASIGDPIVMQLIAGTRLMARAGAADGGINLAMLLKATGFLREVSARELPIEALMGTEENWRNSLAAKVFQGTAVSGQGLALNAFLPDGQALVLETGLDLVGDERTQVVVLRKRGGKVRSFFDLDPGPGFSHMRVYRTDGIDPPRLDYTSALLRGGSWLPAGMPGHMYGWLETDWTILRGPDIDFIYEFASDERNYLPLGESWFLSAQRADGESQPAGEDLFWKQRQQPGQIELELILRDQGDGGRELARTCLPMRLGSSSGGVLGVESFAVSEYDVEVAQHAAIADPRVNLVFDGLIFSARPSRSVGGTLLLDLRARANVLAEEVRTVDLGIPTMQKIEQATYNRLFVNEQLVFEVDGGSGTVVLGDAGTAGRAGSLALEVRVR